MIKNLLYIPSFYGLTMFTVFYIFYSLDLIEFNDGSIESHVIFNITIILFLLATVTYNHKYKMILKNKIASLSNSTRLLQSSNWFLIITYLIVITGLILYLINSINYFGSSEVYFGFLFSGELSNIRSEGENFSDSIGIQLSYFGWISISIIYLSVMLGNFKKKWLWLVIIMFLLNLTFVDRTRPVWILFNIYIMWLLTYYKKLDTKKIIKVILFSIILFAIIFVTIANLTGKVHSLNQLKGWDLPLQTQGILYYGISPYAYFDFIINNEHLNSFNLSRTIYPVLKFGLIFSKEIEVPSLINEFYYVPYPTNVGTFLEPYYRDGGFPYVLFGILIHSFGFNSLGLFLLKYRSYLSLFLFSNLCFINFISFFTPKINGFPIWLFFIITGMSILETNKLRKAQAVY